MANVNYETRKDYLFNSIAENAESNEGAAELIADVLSGSYLKRQREASNSLKQKFTVEGLGTKEYNLHRYDGRLEAALDVAETNGITLDNSFVKNLYSGMTIDSSMASRVNSNTNLQNTLYSSIDNVVADNSQFSHLTEQFTDDGMNFADGKEPELVDGDYSVEKHGDGFTYHEGPKGKGVFRKLGRKLPKAAVLAGLLSIFPASCTNDNVKYEKEREVLEQATEIGRDMTESTLEDIQERQNIIEQFQKQNEDLYGINSSNNNEGSEYNGTNNMVLPAEEGENTNTQKSEPEIVDYANDGETPLYAPKVVSEDNSSESESQRTPNPDRNVEPTQENELGVKRTQTNVDQYSVDELKEAANPENWKSKTLSHKVRNPLKNEFIPRDVAVEVIEAYEEMAENGIISKEEVDNRISKIYESNEITPEERKTGILHKVFGERKCKGDAKLESLVEEGTNGAEADTYTISQLEEGANPDSWKIPLFRKNMRVDPITGEKMPLQEAFGVMQEYGKKLDTEDYSKPAEKPVSPGRSSLELIFGLNKVDNQTNRHPHEVSDACSSKKIELQDGTLREVGSVQTGLDVAGAMVHGLGNVPHQFVKLGEKNTKGPLNLGFKAGGLVTGLVSKGVDFFGFFPARVWGAGKKVVMEENATKEVKDPNVDPNEIMNGTRTDRVTGVVEFIGSAGAGYFGAEGLDNIIGSDNGVAGGKTGSPGNIISRPAIK